jgi:hypothetical protein
MCASFEQPGSVNTRAARNNSAAATIGTMGPAPPTRRLFQFGSGTMFVLVAAAALVCYWLSRPTILANKFVAAMAAQDFAKAEGLFVKDTEGRPVGFPGGFGSADQIRKAAIRVDPLTLWQVISRERYIFVDVPYGGDVGEFDWQISIIATPQGLKARWWAT